MASVKLSAKTEISTVADGDVLHVIDVSDTTDGSTGTSRKMTRTNFLASTAIASPVLTTPQINDTSADHQYVFAVSELTADRTVTMPLLTGNDTFVFNDFTQTMTNKTLTTPVIDQVNDVNGNELAIFVTNASAVNEISIENSATGVNPKILATGESDTGITFENDQSEEILILDSVATSINELTIRSAASGNKPIVAATGAADNGIEFHNDQAEEILILNSIATSVNEFTIASAATGNGPQLEATGGDTNIDIELIAKGTGGVLFTDASEISTGTNTLTAAESGKIVFLNASTEFVTTLPAVAQGLHFTFIVTAAPASASYTVVPASGTTIIGHGVSSQDAGGSVDSANTTPVGTFTFVDGQAVVGDIAEFWCDGTNWFVQATCSDFAAVTFT